ncbi:MULTISPECIES: fumarate hydratase C-terminal domain-containing protein [Brenneria]|uniref:Fumarate hydratase n=1 Tax=Brenneria nigrifluens DSM 30175 = ATCC 13028 TaxID=1121120 RepID=A0A2U1USD6_9GAMM|nr:MULTISPECIES: fumarate hydratase C-terminal domain-containing protein [Brenneria]EHD21114.1 Fe-S type hydro-lyase tartrate/fumarate beta region [Brenneria sp. EniD312]PWC24534.1 fumarate hydratase [Brenneria nigrifluens] [Brenneria nigrifluens DSM 30175 = ATCC 13028]QCR04265.1 fumarate hydratase [Brenneria nigrifluens] [Brenneria nigrifluens DSM 30175 = ATCC 13028]
MAGKSDELKVVELTLPVSAQALAQLEIGTVVYLRGNVYTAREGVYRMILDEGRPLPLDLRALSLVNFHCSPAAAPDGDGGYQVGAVTATASFRFARWMERWLSLSGSNIILGKGGMPLEQYRQVLVPAGAVYLTTVGYGTGALLGRGIKRVIDVHWLEELGIAQAMWLFEVERFGPFIVESDLRGNSLFEQHNQIINAGIDVLYQGLKPPTLHRYGETDDRRQELM